MASSSARAEMGILSFKWRRSISAFCSAEIESRLHQNKLVTPFYQHVDGTSFAAPITASVVACMLEANPKLIPMLIRDVLKKSAHPVPNVPVDRQGAGALDAGRAVAAALQEDHSRVPSRTPVVIDDRITFSLHDHEARAVQVFGSWNEWSDSGPSLDLIESGLWQVTMSLPPPGTYAYKFLLNGSRWLDDPANPVKTHDQFGGFNSAFTI